MIGKPRELSAKDDAALSALLHAVEHLDVGREPVLKMIATPMRDLLRAKYAGGYGLHVTESGLECAFFHSQLPGTVVNEMSANLAGSSIDSWTRYNPLCPEPDQRNTVKLFTPDAVVGLGVQPVLEKYDLTNHHARALVCEGPSMLAWVGGFIDEKPGPREAWILEKLIPLLQKRLLLERQLAACETMTATVDLAIEHIAGAAFVLSGRGQLLHANSAGRSRLRSGRTQLMRRLASALRGQDPTLEVHVTSGTGIPQYLVIEKATVDAGEHRARVAAQRWGLTQRQSDVLICIVKGHSNARVSAELGISPRTVEVHVTAIFERAEVVSRAELISAVLKIG